MLQFDIYIYIYINSLCLVSLAKSYIFWDKLWNLIVYVCIVLCTRPTDTRNRNWRPPLESFRRHKSNGGLRISKRTFIRNHVFQGDLFRLGLCKTLITWYLELYFENWAYPCTHVDKYGLIVSLNYCFDFRTKIWHFGWFCP